jgi:FtsP/CotA-like multicopper oxidase with cupredoxin domain
MFSWADLDVQLFAQEAGLVTCRGGLSVPVTTAFEYAPAFDWKDTLFVRTKIPFGGLQPDSKGYYRFIVRTRYERYIGEFVLHCHILDHEDSGMMQNVQIDLPVGPGGMSHEHH